MRITVEESGSLAARERGSLRRNDCGEEDRDGSGGRRREKRLMWLFCSWQRTYLHFGIGVFSLSVRVSNVLQFPRKYRDVILFQLCMGRVRALKHLGREVFRHFDLKVKRFLFSTPKKPPRFTPAQIPFHKTLAWSRTHLTGERKSLRLTVRKQLLRKRPWSLSK